MSARACPPVLVLGYCRPHLAHLVLARLREVGVPKVYVSVDGPRDDHDRPAVEKMRGIIKEIDWQCSVKTRFLDEHLGCRRAVSSAITWFFEHEDEGIILEDDCLPHASFFEYCQSSLDYYRDEPRVYQITGSNIQKGMISVSRCQFARWSGCWGWATWRRAWQAHDPEECEVIKDWTDPGLLKWLGRASELRAWKARQEAVIRGVVDSWCFLWQLRAIQNRHLALLPSVNLIENVGFGESSTHTNQVNARSSAVPAEQHPLPVVFPEELRSDEHYESLSVRSRLEEFVAPCQNAKELISEILGVAPVAKNLRNGCKLLKKNLKEITKVARANKHRQVWWPFANQQAERLLRQSLQASRDAAVVMQQAAHGIEWRVDPLAIRAEAADGPLNFASLSYSQEGEDMLIDRLLKGIERGFYVDVGAHHPFRFSNTFRFYQRGWTGINLDPTPGCMRHFLIWRRRDINLEIGVAAREGLHTFYVFEEAAYNTSCAERARAIEQSGRGGACSVHTVEMAPLSKILDKNLPPGACIDFLTVDVEGTDLEVLSTLDFERHRPRLLLAEGSVSCNLAAALDDPLVRFCANQGYALVASTARTFFFADRRTPASS